MSARRRLPAAGVARKGAARAAPRTPRSTGRAMEILIAAGCAALSLWVQRRSLSAYFCVDDLIALERVRGLVPPHPIGWWRLLSGPLYFTAALDLFGTAPGPYHVIGWLLHGVNVALAYALARAWGGGRGSAAVGAVVFGASSLFGTVLDQVVGIGAELTLAFTCAAFLAVGRTPARAGVAATLFAAALLGKETALLAPLVLLLPIDRGTPWSRRRVPVFALLGVSIAMAIALVAARVGAVSFGGDAYARAYGVNLWHNLMTYLAWTVDLHRAEPDMLGLSTTAWRVGVVVVALAVATAALHWRRSALAAAGVAWFLVMIAPVLPLLHHSFQLYLYPAYPGFAWVVGEAVGGVAGIVAMIVAREPTRRSQPRAGKPRTTATAGVAGFAVAVLALVIARHSDALIERRWNEVVPGLGPLDPQLRRTVLAHNVLQTLGPALGRDARRLAFVMPLRRQRRTDPKTGRVVDEDRGLSYREMLIASLDDGRAIRLMHPGVDSVAFLERWTPQYRGFDLIGVGPMGACKDLGPRVDAHYRVLDALIRGGNLNAARDHWASASAAFPGDSGLVAIGEQLRARGVTNP